MDAQALLRLFWATTLMLWPSCLTSAQGQGAYYNPARQVYDIPGHRRLSGQTVLTNVGLVNAFGKPHAYLSRLPGAQTSTQTSLSPPTTDDSSSSETVNEKTDDPNFSWILATRAHYIPVTYQSESESPTTVDIDLITDPIITESPTANFANNEVPLPTAVQGVSENAGYETTSKAAEDEQENKTNATVASTKVTEALQTSEEPNAIADEQTTLSKEESDTQEAWTNEIVTDPGLWYQPIKETVRRSTTQDFTVDYTNNDRYVKTSTASGTQPVELFSNHGFMTSTTKIEADKKEGVTSASIGQDVPVVREELTTQGQVQTEPAELVLNNQKQEQTSVSQDNIVTTETMPEKKVSQSNLGLTSPLSFQTFHFIADKFSGAASETSVKKPSLVEVSTETKYNETLVWKDVPEDVQRDETLVWKDVPAETTAILQEENPQAFTKPDFKPSPSTVLIASNYPPVTDDASKTEVTAKPSSPVTEQETSLADVTKEPVDSSTVLIASNYPPEAGATIKESVSRPSFYFNKEPDSEDDEGTTHRISTRIKPFETETEATSSTPLSSFPTVSALPSTITTAQMTQETTAKHSVPTTSEKPYSSFLKIPPSSAAPTAPEDKPKDDEEEKESTIVEILNNVHGSSSTTHPKGSTMVTGNDKDQSTITPATQSEIQSYSITMPLPDSTFSEIESTQDSKVTPGFYYNLPSPAVSGYKFPIPPHQAYPPALSNFPYNRPSYASSRPLPSTSPPSTSTLSTLPPYTSPPSTSPPSKSPPSTSPPFDSYSSSSSSFPSSTTLFYPSSSSTSQSTTYYYPSSSSSSPSSSSTSIFSRPASSSSSVMELFNNVAPSTTQSVKTSESYKSTPQGSSSTPEKTTEIYDNTIQDSSYSTNGYFPIKDYQSSYSSYNVDSQPNQESNDIGPVKGTTHGDFGASRYPPTSISVVTSIYEETNPYDFFSTSNVPQKTSSQSYESSNKPYTTVSTYEKDKTSSPYQVTDQSSSTYQVTDQSSSMPSKSEAIKTTLPYPITETTFESTTQSDKKTSTTEANRRNTTTTTSTAVPPSKGRPVNGTRLRPTRPVRPTRPSPRPRPRPTRPTPPIRPSRPGVRPGRPANSTASTTSTTTTTTRRPSTVRRPTPTPARRTTPTSTRRTTPAPTRRTTALRSSTTRRPSTTTPVGFLTQPSYFPQLYQGTRRPTTAAPTGFLTQPSYFPQLSSSSSAQTFDVNNLNGACQKKITNGTVWRATQVPGSAGCGYRCYTGLFSYSTYTMSDDTSCGDSKKCVNGKCILEDDITVCKKAGSGRPISNVAEILCRAVCSFDGTGDRVVARQEGTPCSPLGFFRCSNGLCLPSVVAT